MADAPRKWYNRWWALLLAMALGCVAGWLLQLCWMNAQSGLNL